jgi:hypothetical protein
MGKKDFADGTAMPNETVSDEIVPDKTVAGKTADKVVGDEKIVEGKTKFTFGEKNGYTEEQVIELLKNNPENYRLYTRLNGGWKKRFMDYMTARKTLPLTYDPFFKRIFNPEIHNDRLSDLISSIIGIKVRVVRILPVEDVLLKGDSLLIMDILVELADGSLANVEVQKIPYKFPAERVSCYSADLVLRQYNRVKSGQNAHTSAVVSYDTGQDELLDSYNFSYSDLKTVYTIVIFEKSPEIMKRKEYRDKYIHHGKTVFDTGLPMKMLQEYYLIGLDVFKKSTYPKTRCNLTAWLSLLATEDMSEVDALIEEYPWLEEIYREMAEYMYRPEEVLNMFSEALSILDSNTVRLMIDEMNEKLAEQGEQLAEQKEQLAEKDGQLAEKDGQLAEKDGQLAEKDGQLAEKDGQLAEKNEKLAEQDKLILELKRQLAGLKG